MKQWLCVVIALLAMATAMGADALQAQEAGVGELRIVDQTGAELGREDAPPGEKHFRLPTGTTGFRVAFDYQGSTATPVQVRVMGPSGTVLLQTQEVYSTPGTYTVDFTNDGGALADQEYVVNVYLGADPYLADSLQLVVGSGQIPGPVEADAPTAAPQDAAAAQLAVNTAETAPDASRDIPGSPSWRVLLLAGLGIVALALVVVWAGWSAMKRG